MNKKILVHGSFAIDYIMDFNGNLYDNVHIDHESRSFEMAVMPSTKRMQFGGTAGNIAYNLGLLEAPAVILGSVGVDFKTLKYEQHLKTFKSLILNLERHSNDFCANCYIVNDKKSHQLIIYHGGVTNIVPSKSLKERIKNIDEISIAINSPENPQLMFKLSNELKQSKIKNILDTGQVTPYFSREQFEIMIKNSDILICNENEYNIICQKVDLTDEEVFEYLKAIVRTEGARGSTLFFKDKKIKIPSVQPKKVLDPTGAGDAFRAGFLYALYLEKTLEDACKLGATVSSFVVETIGAQTHKFSKEELIERYEKNFGKFIFN